MKRKSLGCDVELGNVGDTIKYGTILLVSGGLVYAMWKFNLFGGLRWIKDAFKDIYRAPETIAVWEDSQVGEKVNQINKIFNILKQKADNFNSEYGSLNSEWQTLKSKAVSSFGKESYKKTFYESAKMSYFGSKSSKEKLMNQLDKLRTKTLTELRKLQTRKNFKVNSRWEIVGCIPCLF